MVQTPSYEEFTALVVKVEEIRAENDFLRSVLLGMKWLSRQQVLMALSISATTLWRLTQANTLVHIVEGNKTMYDINSIRDYLKSKKINQQCAEERIIKAIYARNYEKYT